MTHQSRLTIKGQVTIPRDIRAALGLKPGERVEFVRTASGETVIRRLDEAVESEAERRARVEAAISAVAGRFCTGQATDDYMHEIRGPYAP